MKKEPPIRTPPAALLKSAFSDLRDRWGLLFSILTVMLATFISGFGLAMLIRPKPPQQSTGIPPTDFVVTLPEGSTTITITDPQLDNSLLTRFAVERHGDSIEGLPESHIDIAPRISLSNDDVVFFRRELAGVVSPLDPVWQRANQIRNWLATRQYRGAVPGLATRVPREAYVQMRQGKPVLCGNLAEIYVALCESAGLVARTVGLSLMVRDGTFGSDTHAGAEVWVPESGGWVYQDPTFNCYWEIDGKPGSALHLHDALMDGREIKLVSQSPKAEALVRDYYVDPRLLFRHISYEYKAGGPLLYYVDGRLEPLNMRDRYWIQTSDRTVVEALDTNGNTVVERRGEVARGVFVQLIGNNLFVRDRREANRGIPPLFQWYRGGVRLGTLARRRARSFQGKNLVKNGSFTLTERSEGVAQSWSVSGPVEVLTIMGGQGMATQAGGRLWQRVEVDPGKRYLMYARLSVARGSVTWSLADPSRGMGSKGVVRPSTMSEVVSDVVESRGGYLEVSFESPEGGGFRVMDVIVSEVSADAYANQQLVTQRIAMPK